MLVSLLQAQNTCTGRPADYVAPSLSAIAIAVSFCVAHAQPSTSTFFCLRLCSVALVLAFLHEIKSHGSDAYVVVGEKRR